MKGEGAPHFREIEPTTGDINPAPNLTPSMYTSPAVFSEEGRAIFSRDWSFACPADKVTMPGDYVSVTVARAPLKSFAVMTEH